MGYNKIHSKNTLNQWTKAELIEQVMCLEHNNKVMEERFLNQSNYLIKFLTEKKGELVLSWKGEKDV